MKLRLLRLALGVVAGGVLAVVGASLQGLLQNPLADPFTLGVASGAALGSTPGAGVRPDRGAVRAAGRVRRRAGDHTCRLLAGPDARTGHDDRPRPGRGHRQLPVLSSLVMLVMILGRRTLGEAVYMMMGHLGVVFTSGTLWLFAGASVVALAADRVALVLQPVARHHRRPVRKRRRPWASTPSGSPRPCSSSPRCSSGIVVSFTGRHQLRRPGRAAPGADAVRARAPAASCPARSLPARRSCSFRTCWRGTSCPAACRCRSSPRWSACRSSSTCCRSRL